MLEIRNLHVEVEGQPILRGVDLTINDGEVHSMMGPNGSGKSTLAQVLAGRDTYEVTEGTVRYRGEDLLEMEPDKQFSDIYFDQLQEIFTRETGFYTHM